MGKKLRLHFHCASIALPSIVKADKPQTRAPLWLITHKIHRYFQALQLLTSISTDELHPGDKGLNPGSSNPAIKFPGKNNVLEMQNDTDVEKKEIVPHLKLETMYGQMENKQIQIPTSHHVFYIDISSINWLKTCASKIKL